ncbi:MAG: hypothetical protein AB1568_03150 [Thermodesulfobacteriota bacterium]
MKYMKRTLGLFLIVFFLVGSAISACGFLGFGGTSWKEEVLLHDHSKIIVERTVKRGGRHEIGQQSPYKYQSLVFRMPGTGQKVKWEDKFSQDIGMANFLPMLFDVEGCVAYLVVKPMGCLSYNKWGRPNPPYVIFKYEGKTWQRIQLSGLPAEIKTPNLIFSAPDIAVEKSASRFMTAETIKKIISGYKQPEYRTIIREPLAEEKISCSEMIRVKGGWLGIEWFTSQPTYEQCLNVCRLKKIDVQQCPCDRLFNKIRKEK